MLNQVIVVIPTVNECVCLEYVLRVVLKSCSCFKFVITLLSYMLFYTLC